MSTSSEDEDVSKFREAADPMLYNNSLFTDKQGKKSGSAHPTPVQPATFHPPSLRNIDDEGTSKHSLDLRVTPAFQKHVAKHLTRMLDSCLDIEEGQNDSTSANIKADNCGTEGRKIVKAKRLLAPPKLAISGTNSLSGASESSGSSGVRLFGASAVFLSNLDIVPAPQRRRKRGRITARISSGSDSSSDSSSNESDEFMKASAAAVTPDWILSGAATKGWAKKPGNMEDITQTDNRYELLVKLPNDGGNCNHNNNNNNNHQKYLSDGAKDDLTVLHSKKKKKKDKRRAHSLDGDTLAASFNAAVSLSSAVTSESTTEVDKELSKEHKKAKKAKKKKKRKDQHSEDATTETTEVEDVDEGRKKKMKKRKKSQRLEEMKREEEEMMQHVVPGLLDDDDDEGIGGVCSSHRERKKKKKRNKEKDRQAKSLFKVKKASKPISKKKLNKNLGQLSTDLAKLMIKDARKIRNQTNPSDPNILRRRNLFEKSVS